MNWIVTFITGGWLAGKRTYVIGFAVFVQAFASWAVGDMTFAEFADKLPVMLEGLGLMTLRAGVAEVLDAFRGYKTRR